MTVLAAPARRRLLLPAVVVLLAAGTRLAYLLSPAMQFNADEATTGIMVRRILAGHGYVYYAGQSYGGALEQYLEAAVYAVTRLPQNELTLRLPLVALSAVTCALVHRVALDVLGDPVRALVAAALYAVSPWFNVVVSVTSLGFYAVGQTLTIAVLWCALRAGRGDRRWLFGTGLCAGLGLWTAVTALYVLIPVAAWLLPVLARDRRRWGAAAAGLGLGALPLLGALAVHRRLPVPANPAQPSSVLQRVGNLFGPILRQYVGVTYAHSEGGLWLPVQVAVVAGLVLAYLVALGRRRGLADLLRGRVAQRRPADLLLAVPPVVLVLWAASDATWYTGTPRYLAGTFPLLVIGLAALVPARPPVAVPAVAVAAALSLGFFPTVADSHTRHTDEVLAQVTDVLVAEHHTDVYAGYWTAMPLQYVAGDRLVVATAIGVRRFPDAQAAVQRAPSPVWVGSDHDGTAAVIRSALDRGRVPYRARRIGFLTLFDQLPGTADPEALGI